MNSSRSLVGTVAFAALLVVVGAACSSSSPKASPAFVKGATLNYTPGSGTAPAVSAKFLNCVYGKLSSGDRATVAKITTKGDSDSVSPDAVQVRLTRASHQCDSTLLNQLVTANIFAGAPSSVTAAQKACVPPKAIANIDAIDDSHLSGKNTKQTSDAVLNALKACGVSVNG
jgi:hypothetical protein